MVYDNISSLKNPEHKSKEEEMDILFSRLMNVWQIVFEVVNTVRCVLLKQKVGNPQRYSDFSWRKMTMTDEWSQKSDFLKGGPLH